MQMTNRERILAALNKKPTDRLPFAPLIDPYFINSLPEQGLNMEIIECMRYIGNDIIERHVPSINWHHHNVGFKEERNGNTVHLIQETPVGSIYQENVESGKTSIIKKHLIESIEDAKVFTYIAEHTDFSENFASFYERDKYIGESGIASPSGPMSPIQEVLQSLAGIENTVYLLMDYPDEMEALFDAMHRRNLRHYKILSELNSPLVIDYEDTSSTVMSRDMFENYSAPAINEYSDIVKASGKKFITHMCGKLSVFADKISECRMDGIDSLCPPNTGDFCCYDARARWGDKKIIIGGIDPPELSFMNVRQTLEYVVDIIRKMPDMTGFILSTGDAVPYGTPINNLRAVVRLIELLGRESLLGKFDDSVIDKVSKEFE